MRLGNNWIADLSQDKSETLITALRNSRDRVIQESTLYIGFSRHFLHMKSSVRHHQISGLTGLQWTLASGQSADTIQLTRLLCRASQVIHWQLEVPGPGGPRPVSPTVRSFPELWSGFFIQISYNLYPREYVFTPKNIYPNLNKKASQASLDARLNALFAFTGKRVSVNSLRSSYVSYMVHQAMLKGRLLSVKDKNKIAEKTRSSRKYFDEIYTKLF